MYTSIHKYWTEVFPYLSVKLKVVSIQKSFGAGIAQSV